MIAKRRRQELLEGSGGPAPQKILKSRSSDMPFLAFSWWYFPPQHNQNPNYLKQHLCLLSVLLVIISTVSFRNDILEALKCYFSICGEKNINLVHASAPVEVYSLLKASL